MVNRFKITAKKLPGLTKEEKTVLQEKVLNKIYESIAVRVNPIKVSEKITARVKALLDTIEKVRKNHDEGKKIRGEVVTDIIDLDELLEEIIVERYIYKSFREKFAETVLQDRNFSSQLKFLVVARSGLINKETKKSIQKCLEIRNLLVHRKYRPTAETVEIFLEENIKDIKSLRKTFKKEFKKAKAGIKAASEKI